MLKIFPGLRRVNNTETFSAPVETLKSFGVIDNGKRGGLIIRKYSNNDKNALAPRFKQN